MGSSEKFCLRWNDFESNVSLAFREIREEKDFFDCTLSCGSRQIQAHKLILSACSPFFRSILRQNPHQHPLLYLKGVEFNDLQAVLNFMYHGEVNVAQEELNSFLAVAEDLKVKGLTQGNSNDMNSSNETKSEPSSSSIPRPRPPREEVPPVPKRPRPAPPARRYQEDDEIQEVMPVVKQEPVPVAVEPLPPPQPLIVHQPQEMYQPTHTTNYQENTVAQMDETYGDDGYDYGGYGGEEYEGVDNSGAGADQSKDPSHLVEVEIDNSSEKFRCVLCGKIFSDKSNCRKHIKVLHFGVKEPQDPCPLCSKPILRKNMSAHVKNNCPYRQPR